MGGILDRLVHATFGEQLADRADPGGSAAATTPDPVTLAIRRAIAARQSSFTIDQALGLPAVQRGITILCSHGASLAPVAFAGGEPIDPQPRIVSRPTSGQPATFTYETIDSLVETGDAFWRVLDWGFDRYPTLLEVAWPVDVTVTWNPSRTARLYSWRGTPLNADPTRGKVELVHIRIGARPGELRGTSPIVAALDRLAIIAAEDDFAAAYFASGGVPEVVIQSGVRLDKTEADLLKSQYIGDPTDPTAEPVRVVSGDVSLAFPGADPAASQLTETRAESATTIARLLGIPGPLMLVESKARGGTITYQNRGQLLGELMAETVYPVYLKPIEQAWSDLLPSTTSVWFDQRELQAADLATRVAAEQAYVAMGVLQPEEVRAIEGFGQEPITSSPRSRPAPTPKRALEVVV